MLFSSPKKAINVLQCFIRKLWNAWLDVLVVSYYNKIIECADIVQYKYGKVFAFIFSTILFTILIFWMQEANYMSERIFISLVHMLMKM